ADAAGRSWAALVSAARLGTRSTDSARAARRHRTMTKPSKVNERLRTHVTRIGFDLALTHLQMRTLVGLDLAVKRKGYVDVPVPSGRWAVELFITGVRGLIRRGLVTHRPPPEGKPYEHSDGLGGAY